MVSSILAMLCCKKIFKKCILRIKKVPKNATKTFMIILVTVLVVLPGLFISPTFVIIPFFQIEPKDDEISEQSKQIKSLEKQIEDLDGKMLKLKGEIHTQNTTMDFTRRDRDIIGLKLKEQDTFVRRFQGKNVYER